MPRWRRRSSTAATATGTRRRWRRTSRRSGASSNGAPWPTSLGAGAVAEPRRPFRVLRVRGSAEVGETATFLTLTMVSGRLLAITGGHRFDLDAFGAMLDAVCDTLGW